MLGVRARESVPADEEAQAAPPHATVLDGREGSTEGKP